MIFDSIIAAISLIIELFFSVIKLPDLPVDFYNLLISLFALFSEGMTFIVAVLTRSFFLIIVTYLTILFAAPYAIAAFNFIIKKFPILNIR